MLHEVIGESVQTSSYLKIAILPADGFSRRHLSRHPARAPQRLRTMGVPKGRCRAEGFKKTGRRGHVVVPVSLHRDLASLEFIERYMSD